MIALAGRVNGNSIILENDEIQNYDGRTFIITFLDQNVRTARKKLIGIVMVWKQNVVNMWNSIWRKLEVMTEFNRIFIDTSPYIYS